MNVFYRFYIGPAVWTYNKQIDQTGVVRDAEGWACSDIIEVFDTGTMTFSSMSANGGLFYDADFKICGVIAGLQTQIPIPEGTKYMRLNFPLAEVLAGRISARSLQREYAARYVIYPNYSDKMTKTYEMQSDEMYYRATLSEKISLVGNDFDFIDQSDFETLFKVQVDMSTDYGATWQDYFFGSFAKTDGEFDYDNKKVTFSLEPLDQYTDVLSGIENEYDLLELKPEIKPVGVVKRPLIQTYTPGDSVVSCFLAGIYWEQDASAVEDTSELEDKYKFQVLAKYRLITLQSSNATPEDAVGEYFGAVGGKYYHKNNKYYIVGEQPFSDAWIFRLKKADGTLLWDSQQFLENDPLGGLTFVQNYNGSVGELAGQAVVRGDVYMRYLMDVELFNETETFELPTDDIVSDNRNYKRVVPFSDAQVVMSQRFSEEPTKWGIYQPGQYYAPPDDDLVYYPVARSTWDYYSFWFRFPEKDEEYERAAQKRYLLKDAYPLYSCIKVLLKRFAPGVSHEPTAEYSQFLYGERNPITKKVFELYVTQKTNALYGEYDQPAQKAPGTLRKFLDMLKNCFQCYWFIDEDNRFRIEHISWFKNGGSYESVVSEIVTSKFPNLTNGLSWDFASNKITYDKISMPERYEFSWADESTLPFDGYPIEVKSRFITRGEIEDVNVGDFSADIDFMLLNPGAFSQEGFALLATGTQSLLTDPESASEVGIDIPVGGTSTKGFPIQSYAGKAKIEALITGTGVIEMVAMGATLTSIIQRYGQLEVSMGTGLSTEIDIPEGTTRISFNCISGETFNVKVVSLEGLQMDDLTFEKFSIDNINYRVQNGLLSFFALPEYYLDSLPSKKVVINGSDAQVRSVSQGRQQTLKFPIGIADPDPMKVVVTKVGNGKIEKISINLHSRMAELDLRYDTY